jgi:hypothetical protein
MLSVGKNTGNTTLITSDSERKIANVTAVTGVTGLTQCIVEKRVLSITVIGYKSSVCYRYSRILPVTPVTPVTWTFLCIIPLTGMGERNGI